MDGSKGEYMPKKKLTKAQVRTSIKKMFNEKARLLMDKATHSDSFVPFSLNKLIELDKIFVSAVRRIK